MTPGVYSSSPSAANIHRGIPRCYKNVQSRVRWVLVRPLAKQLRGPHCWGHYEHLALSKIQPKAPSPRVQQYNCGEPDGKKSSKLWGILRDGPGSLVADQLLNPENLMDSEHRLF